MINGNASIQRGKYEKVREMNYDDITNTFQLIDRRFDTNFGIIYLQNFTNKYIDFSVSFEGLDTTMTLAPGPATFAADMSAAGLIIASGEGVFCKYRTDAPTEGFVQVIAVVPD